jgi:hypothetical protein
VKQLAEGQDTWCPLPMGAYPPLTQALPNTEYALAFQISSLNQLRRPDP